MEKLFKYITPEKVIDIGANIGNFTNQIISQNPNCKVVMVEANPNCEGHLRLLNKPYHIVALSDREGYADLYVEIINPIATGASLYKENTDWYGDGKYKTITVPTKTLDNCDYFNGEVIDLIKIDVQGAELDILNGGEKTIKNTKYVLSEVSLVEYNQGAPLIGDVIDKMKEYGFNILDIIEYHSSPTLYKGAIFQIDVLFKNENLIW
jgi:FkbM family methyltransferase